MSDIIKFAIKAKEAYISYIKNEKCDINICEEINGYIQNIGNLSPQESDKLQDFIDRNTTQHLADIYIPLKSNSSVLNKFNGIIPMRLSKPGSIIHSMKGNLPSIIQNNRRLKIRRKVKY